MFQNIFQHLQKCVCSNVVSSNTNIKFISYLVDGMQLMIFEELGIAGELGIVGSEEHPTYKKKAIIRTQRYQILESKIV